MLLQAHPWLKEEHPVDLLEVHQYAAKVWHLGLKKPVLFEIRVVNVDGPAIVHHDERFHQGRVRWHAEGFSRIEIFFKTVAQVTGKLVRSNKNLLCKLKLFAELCNDLDHILSVFKEGITIDVDDGEPKNVYETLSIASKIHLVCIVTKAIEIFEAVDGQAWVDSRGDLCIHGCDVIGFIVEVGNRVGLHLFADYIVLRGFVEKNLCLRVIWAWGNVCEALQANQSAAILRTTEIVLKNIRLDGVIKARGRGISSWRWGILRSDENGRGIEEGCSVIEGISMNQHVIHVFKVLDVNQSLHSRVLEEFIINDLDRPDVLSDHNQTFDLQGVLSYFLILALNALFFFNIVKNGAVFVSYYIILESISDNLELSIEP